MYSLHQRWFRTDDAQEHYDVALGAYWRLIQAGSFGRVALGRSTFDLPRIQMFSCWITLSKLCQEHKEEGAQCISISVYKHKAWELHDKHEEHWEHDNAYCHLCKTKALLCTGELSLFWSGSLYNRWEILPSRWAVLKSYILVFHLELTAKKK